MSLIELHSSCAEVHGAENKEIESFISELTEVINKGNDNDWACEAEYYIRLALSNVLYDKRLMEAVISKLLKQKDYRQIFEKADT